MYIRIELGKGWAGNITMLNKNILGVKKVRGQSEAALQIGMYDQKL